MLIVNIVICLGAGQGTPTPAFRLAHSFHQWPILQVHYQQRLICIRKYLILCHTVHKWMYVCVCVCICACIGKAEGLDWTAQSTIYTITLLDGHQLIPRCWSLCHCGSDLNGQIGFTKVGLSNWDANMLFLGSPQWHGLCKTNAAVCSYGELDGKMSLIWLVCQNPWSPATGASLEGGDSLRR